MPLAFAGGNLDTSSNPGRAPRSFDDPNIGIYPNGIAQDILADLLRRGITTPEVEILVQYPATSFSTLQLGQALGLDGITSVTVSRNEDPTADTLDFAVSNGDGRYLPKL